MRATALGSSSGVGWAYSTGWSPPGQQRIFERNVLVGLDGYGG